MNRAEKRKMDRLEQWFNSLSDDKKQKIYEIINAEVNSNNDLMAAISDTCTISALDDVLDIDISKMKDVITKTKEYLIDYGEYLQKEKNGGIKMIESVELRNKIKDKIRSYIKGKIDKARGLKLLKNEFNLPFAELSDLWIECKEDPSFIKTVKKSKEEPKVEPKVEPIKSKEIESENITPKVIESANTTISYTTPKEKNNLKIIKVTTEIQGEYGTYIKNDNGVKIGNMMYNDLNDVKTERIKITSEYNLKLENIKEKLNELNKQLVEIKELSMKEIEKFSEIELVFKL